MTKHHIIFIPGILDDIYHLQSLAVLSWRLYGVRGHLHEMPWLGGEDYSSKLKRLHLTIDNLLKTGDTVSLMGASAGASAAMNVYAQSPHKIQRLILICPKLNHPELVSQHLYDANPAFKASLASTQLALQRLSSTSKQHIVTYYSPADQTVPYRDSVVPGVTEHTLPALRHGYAIFYCLTIGAYRIFRDNLRYVYGK